MRLLREPKPNIYAAHQAGWAWTALRQIVADEINHHRRNRRLHRTQVRLWKHGRRV